MESKTNMFYHSSPSPIFIPNLMLNEMTWLFTIPLTTFTCTTIERPMTKLKTLQSQSKSLGPLLPTN
jgi:hypothetical protein